jgi:hypothetical protein
VLWEFGTNPDEALGFFDSVVGIQALFAFFLTRKLLVP